MSRSSATATRIVPRPSNKKLKKLEKLKKKASNNSAPSSQGSTISTQSEEVVSHEDESSKATNSIISEDSVAMLNDQPNEATPILCENELDTEKVNEHNQFTEDDKTADAESLSNCDDENPKGTDSNVLESEDVEVTTPQEEIPESQDTLEKQNPISHDIKAALKQSTMLNDRSDTHFVGESSSLPDPSTTTDVLNNKSFEPDEEDNVNILSDDDIVLDIDELVEQDEVIPNTNEPPVEQDEIDPNTNEPVEQDEIIPDANEPVEQDEMIPNVNEPVKQDEIIPNPDLPVEQDEVVPNTHEPVEQDVLISVTNEPVEQDEIIPDVNEPVEQDEIIPNPDLPVEQDEVVPNTHEPVEQDVCNFKQDESLLVENKQKDLINSLSDQNISREEEEVVKSSEYVGCADKEKHSQCFEETKLEDSPLKENVSAGDCVEDITVGDESDIVDLKISETYNDQVIKIKQDFLDVLDIEADLSAKDSATNQTEDINMILNHRKYVLKSVTTGKTTLSTSQLLDSKLNVDFDIAVSILDNGHIKFSNISNKHSLNLEYDLLALLNISVSHLKSLKVYLKSNYSTNLLNDKVQGEINPSVLIIDTFSGTLWDFENIRSSFVSQTPLIRKNDILRKLNLSTEKDISFLRKSGCLLLKTDKNQLVLYNIYKNQIAYLKDNYEKQGKGFFRKMFSYGNSPRDDVIDYVIEDGHNEDTIVVLFKSDILMYHIRKHNDLPDAKYHFDRNEEFHAIEKDGLIYNNILNSRIPITLLRLNRVYSNKNASFYALLICTSYSEYILVSLKISDRCEVVGHFELQYLKHESMGYTKEISVQTSYIDQQDFYTYFLTYRNEIFFSQVPLCENKKQSVFSDVLTFKPETKVFSGSIYQVEYAKDRSSCLSFQTDAGGQYTFYQLHLKNEDQCLSETAAYSEFLNFHLRNYVFNRIIDNDQELFDNKVDHKRMSLVNNAFEKAFNNQVDETMNNTEILPENKSYIFENVLSNIKDNLHSWTTTTSKEFVKLSVLNILEHLSNIKVLIQMPGSTSSAEESVINTFGEFTQQFMSCDLATLKVDNLLDVVTNVIYESLLCGIELNYRFGNFEELLGKNCYNSVLFSSNVNHNLVNFISMAQSLDLDVNEKVFCGFLNLLKVIYYQNAFGINKLDTLVVSIGNVLNIFKGKLELHQMNLLKDMTVINKDWVSTFKIYDYLSASQKIQYVEYQNFFGLEEDKNVLIKCFLDLYLNKDFKTKLQNFFDIMSGIDSPAFIKDVYKELASREKKGNVPEILWAFETLINKDYKKAFKALSEIESNKVNFIENKAKGQDFEGFKDSMMRLCEVLSANEEN
ncbi:hypothetical protein ACO0OL_003212 [Hanseniaspora opuntiae]